MTLPRQYVYTALLGGILSASGAARAAEGSAVSEQLSEGAEYIGPPTAAEIAAGEAAAKRAAPLAPVVAPVATPKPAASAWLASRPAPKPAAGKSALPGTGRMVGLVLVLGTLAVAALYLKKRNRGEVKRLAAPKRLSVLSSTRIGPKAHAVVISVNGRQMLLGVTDASVERLAFVDELDEERDEREHDSEPRLAVPGRLAAQAVRAAAPHDPAQSRSFAEILKTTFRKPPAAPEADAALLLAAETQDVVGGRPVVSNVRMLDVEGQAQGLIRRLSGPRA
ncbi:MAG TPA: flagellar biosynthetic protein FliO [Polyangiaceae bacterium]|nr:flagellar biosynthetic protein FliO [Polyangiaceae bacterium]